MYTVGIRYKRGVRLGERIRRKREKRKERKKKGKGTAHEEGGQVISYLCRHEKKEQ